MEKSLAKIAVIILNWNGAALTEQCIHSMLTSDIGLDIFVCDNGSTVNEAEILRQKFGDTIWLQRSAVNLGFAGGNNAMMRNLLEGGNYDYIVLLNQDTVVHPGCFGILADYMDQHLKTAVCGAKVLNTNGTIQSVGGMIDFRTGKVTSLQQGAPDKNLPNPMTVDCVIGNCFFIRVSALQQIGLFDDDYFAYYEEADWCVRASRAGWDCVVVPTAIITHEKTSGFRTYLITRNMIWFEKKFATWQQLTWFWFYFWCMYLPERVKKGSHLLDLLRGAFDGWFRLNKGKGPEKI